MKAQRLFLFILVLTTILLTIPPLVSAQSASGTVIRNLNLRSGPGTEWRRVGFMPAGTAINVDGRNASATWIRGITQSSQVGWMLASYTSVSVDQIGGLPVIAWDAPLTVGAPGGGAVAPAPAPAVAAAPAPAASGGMVGTTTAGLNVRSGPGTNFARVGRLTAGQPFSIDGRDGSGRWVRGVGPSGQAGWVSVAYVAGVNLAALPVVDNSTPVTAAPASGAPAPAAAAPAMPAPVVSNAPVSGFATGGHVLGLSEMTVNAMRRAGMTWVKKQFRYTQGQDPSAAAGLINDAHSKGFRIVLGIVGSRDQVNNGNYFNDYANFVGGVAALGADAIEVWNEPNIDREWPTGQVDPGRYTQLLAASYNAIKSRNPNTMVISGAPAPTGFFGGCAAQGCDDAVYIQGMAAAGAANYMDCVGIHYNEGIIPPSQTSGDPRSEHYTRYFNGMVNAYWNAIGGRRPLCFTEIGYLSPEGYGPLPGGFSWAGGTSVAQQAAWLDEAANMARNSGRVRMFIVWNIDFTEYGADPMGGYAIIRPGGACPACDALGS